MEIILVFIIGLIFGSFLNVVIYRLKSGKPIGFGRSFCPQCRTILKWHDLVPVLSFLWLKRKCRHCGKKISWQYPAVELLSGLIWVGVFYKVFELNFQFSVFNFQLLSIFYQIIILSVLLVIAVYDARHFIIPDKIIYPAIGLALAYNALAVWRSGNFSEHFWMPLGAAAAVFLFLFSFFYFFKGRAMGFGDAKLGFLIGLFLGPFGALLAVFLAFVAGAAYGIIMIIIGRKSLKSRVAFGPFLAAGAAISFFFADYILKISNFLSW